MQRKLLALSPEVATLLDKEDNQSALVDALLHDHYGITISGEGAHIVSRRQVLEQLREGVPAATDPDLVYQNIVEPLNEEVVHGLNGQDNAIIENSNGGSETPIVEQGASDSGQVPHNDHASDAGRVHKEVRSEEPVDKEVPLVIKVDGVIAQICDLHGPYIGTCIDCM